MTGPEAAELFYRQDLFARRGAAPGRIQKTLLGQGGVQGLDGEAHRHRKQMFMSLMTPESIEELKERTADWWRTYARKRATMERVTLYAEMQQLLTGSVCGWAGRKEEHTFEHQSPMHNSHAVFFLKQNKDHKPH